MTLPRVGVIGVGAMGGGMVRALVKEGFRVVVRDLVAQREDEAVAAGAAVAASPAEVAARSEVLVTVVVDAQQTRDVLLAAPLSCRTVMMCSTIAPADASDIAAKLAAQGIALLDAPVSGGPARAREGTLSMMASGSEEAFGACERVIAALTSRCFRISAVPGDGSRMKVVNNMLAAANLAAGCEAMAMASKLGLDLHQVADVVNASSGQSWIFADRMARALQGDYAPRAAARVLLKDVGLFVGEARNLGLTASMAECAREIFHDTVARGLAEEDDAAVLKRYAQAWKVKLP